MKKPHKKMPPLEFLHDRYDYDPLTGGLYKKGAEPCEENVCGSFAASGHRVVHVPGYGNYMVHRLVYFLFHRKDPGHYMIDHKNCDPADNRIENLRRVRPRKNALNTRKKAKCVVVNGVSRVVGSV